MIYLNKDAIKQFIKLSNQILENIKDLDYKDWIHKKNIERDLKIFYELISLSEKILDNLVEIATTYNDLGIWNVIRDIRDNLFEWKDQSLSQLKENPFLIWGLLQYKLPKIKENIEIILTNLANN